MSNAISKNFFGMDAPSLFIGVVESRQDPLGLGRVQVRCAGWHSDSLGDIPSENLPWAEVGQPGTFKLFGTPKEADVVLGFFADGRSAQVPIVIAILPGIPSIPPNTGQGFNDLRSDETIKNAPKKPVSRTYATDGSGVKVKEVDTSNTAALGALRHPNALELGVPSYPGVTRYQNLANTVIGDRKVNLDKGIISAAAQQWDEPYPAYNALYPYNSAIETESGHIIEFDDTPGSERLAMAHRSGAFFEFYPTGSKVEKITRSNYQIVMADDHLHVMGRVMITVGGDAYIRTVGNTNLEVDQSLNIAVAQDCNVTVGRALNFKAQSLNFDIAQDIDLISQGGQFFTAAAIDVNASGHVNLQSGTDTNILASGDVNAQGDNLNLSASKSLAMGGQSVGTDVPFQAPSFDMSSLSPGSASDAASGSPAGLGAAPGAGNPTNATVAEEIVPIPLPSNFAIEFDSTTGTAFIQQQFLNPDGSHPTATPFANTPCNFDPMTRTFLPSSAWGLSSSGTAFLQANEGLAKVIAPGQIQAYPDPVTKAQPYTIGYGSTQAGTGQEITLATIISMETATNWMDDTVNNSILPSMRKLITVQLTQSMVDALVDFIYNVGTGNFAKSTLLKDINAQSWCQAGADFGNWTLAAGQQVPGLLTRRTKERQLFLS